MSKDDDIDELMKRKLCFDCIGENFLKDQVSKKGRRGKCSYCHRNLKCYSIEELSKLVQNAFEQHYRKTSDQPDFVKSAMIAGKDADHPWRREGEQAVEAIMNAAEIPEQAAFDIQKILEEKFSDYDAHRMGEETEFSSDSHYEERDIDDTEWQAEWSHFEHSLKTEARFFGQYSSKLLTSVFSDIESMETWNGNPLVIEAGPGTVLKEAFRARSFQSDNKLRDALARPEQQLGSPPSTNAPGGRMNAHGISVFYGANDPLVALAEVRPPVGSQVAIARFDIIRPLRLLDLTALREIKSEGSIFDPDFVELLKRISFLQNLSHQITKPVMPEHETFEYLATQVIGDFLSTEREPSLDGIVFPSVQIKSEKSLNLVLFQKSSRVEPIDLPDGVEISVELGQDCEDGWEEDYSVIEEVPTQSKSPKKLAHQKVGTDRHPSFYDERPCTLKIDIKSIHVHGVKSIQYDAEKFKVSRHRFPKVYNPPF